jgi:hypothetical protein
VPETMSENWTIEHSHEVHSLYLILRLINNNQFKLIANFLVKNIITNLMSYVTEVTNM